MGRLQEQLTWIHEVCRANGATALLGRKDWELWVHRSDQHPNAAAHRIAGEALLALAAHLPQAREVPAQRGPAS